MINSLFLTGTVQKKKRKNSRLQQTCIFWKLLPPSEEIILIVTETLGQVRKEYSNAVSFKLFSFPHRDLWTWLIFIKKN